MKNRSYAPLIFLLLFFVDVFAQQSDYVFYQFSTEDNAVECVLQDRRGFVWAGTYNGLFRYDGEDVKIFRPQQSDSTSISSSYIEALTEDQNGDIWIGTRDGILNCYRVEEQVFSKYILPKGDGFVLNSIRDIEIESDTVIWCALERGIAKFNPLTQVWKNYLPSQQSDYWNYYYDVFYQVAQDPTDPALLWAGGRSEIFKFDKKTERFDTLRPAKGRFPYAGLTNVIFDEDIIWFASNASTLIEYHPAQDSAAAYKYPFANNLLYRGIAKVGEQIWVAQYTGGLGVFDITTKQYTFFEHNPAISTSIAKGGARSLAVGNNGELWIGLEEGLSLVRPEAINFQHHHFTSDYSKAIDAFYVRDYSVVNDSSWLVASTVGDGLYIYDPIKRKTRSKISNYPESYKRDWIFDVYSLWQTDAGIIWVGTFHGLYQFDKKDFTLIPFDSTDDKDYSPVLFKDIQKAPNEDLWMRTFRPNGIFHLSADQAVSHHYTVDAPAPYQLMLFDELNDFSVAPSGNVWLVTAPRVSCKKAGADAFEVVFDQGDLASNWPVEVLEDRAGDIWIGYKGAGLQRFRDGQVVANYRGEDGLPSEIIYDLILDEEGNIWISTSNGLSVFMEEEQVFRNFGKGDGLIRADLGFYWASQMVLKSDGHIALAGHGFMTTFDPKKVLQTAANPSLTFKEFLVFDKERKLGKSLQSEDQIDLSYEDHSFTFSVTSFPYSYADKIDYQYRLLGADDNWRISKDGKMAFTNIRSGKYTLEVQERNVPASLQRLFVELHPPLWRTNWFIGLMSFLFGAFLVGIIRWRFNFLQTRAKERLTFEKQLIETEMTALRAQMNPHFLFNSLNSIKKYILKNEPRTASRYLTKFSRLMRYILDNSKESEISLEKELETLELYIELESMRFQNKFDYQMNIAQDLALAHINVPPLLLQPFVENAIWHGLMHKSTPGKLTVNIYKKGALLYLEVEDDGIGRAAATQIKRSSMEKHRSHGVSITEKRLQIFKKEEEPPGILRYEDLIDAEGAPAGTKAIIQIPIHKNLNDQ